MNTSNNTILVKKFLSENLALRDLAKDFFKEVELMPTKEIVLDFKGIKSISRSFAHEYIKQKEKSKKVFNEVNMPENVQRMISIVSQADRDQGIIHTKSLKAISV